MSETSVAFLLVLLLTNPIAEFSCSGTRQDPKVTRNEPGEHPRILFPESIEVLIKSNITTDSAWRSIHGYILKECERILNKPGIKYRLEGKRLLSRAREFQKRIIYLSYAWRLTNDGRFLHRAEEELLQAARLESWNSSHFLDVAEMTLATSIGYDWLYDDLQSTTRAALRDALVKKGLEPSFDPEYNWWLETDGNWNQVCNASMALGALAIYEENPTWTMDIINRSVQSVQLPMKAYEPDGGFPEGYMYWGYGTTFNVYLISALEEAFGTDFGLAADPGFLKTGYFLLNMIGPSGAPFNFSDCGTDLKPNPAMFWLAHRNGDHSLVFNEKEILKKHLYPARDLPFLMMWGANIRLNGLKAPKTLMWAGRGKNPVALMRTSWKPDALFIGIKGGGALENGHSHLDAGSFVMDALGERWAMDLGGQQYEPVERKGLDLWSRKQNSDRWKLFRYSNMAHNTLSFDESLQSVDGYASMINYSDSKDFQYAIISLSDTYKNFVRKAERGVAIVNSSYAVVRDEIETSDRSSTLRWTMVTPASVRILSPSQAELSQNGKKVLIQVVEPEEVSLVTWSTDPPNDYDEPNPGTTRVGFELATTANESLGIQVNLIPLPVTGANTLQRIPLKRFLNSGSEQ